MRSGQGLPQGYSTALGWQVVGGFIWSVLTFLLSFLSLWLEVFLRRDFGERYLSNSLILVSALLFFGSFMGLSLVGSILGGLDESFFLVLIFWVFVIAFAIYHRVQIRNRNARGVKWQSWYRGASRLTPLLASWGLRYLDRHVKLFHEPAVGLAAGVLISVTGLPAALTSALWISAVALFIKEATIQAALRERYLDLVDAQIEADAMSIIAEEGPDALEDPTGTSFEHMGYTTIVPTNEEDVGEFISAVAATNPLVAERLAQRKTTETERGDPDAE